MAQKKNDDKEKQLKQHYVDHTKQAMTTNEGVGIGNDHFELKAGGRGPALLQDFQFQEKLRHFDRERIPERVVHARGTGAHGVFVSAGDFSDLTMADLFSEKGKETPAFVRFSTVQGSRGSADAVRDIRGFAVKFYTQEGNYDIAGISTPVFFIQDAIKFPDLIHAVKPEPKTDVPQGQSAHDNFWDFVSTNREATHMVFWAMSDRGIPRSYRTMEGFGVHTFKWINAKGEHVFVRYHFKPQLGVQSLVWDEALKINGADPDYHRKDLYEAIEDGNYPKYDVCVQIVKPEDEFKFDFDIIDPTKLWPEELVPLTKVGTLELNRNPENAFAETEQVAFSPANIVPGIDFSNDPLLQGRIFAYADAHVHRLGGANFQQIPINRPVIDVYNNQRDGYMQHHIHVNETNYDRNNRERNAPLTAEDQKMPAYVHHQEPLDGRKERGRIEAFLDFYTQPKLFYHSLTDVEKTHLTEAFEFELSKVTSEAIRKNALDMLNHVDTELAKTVGDYLGISTFEAGEYNAADTGDAELKDYGYQGEKVEKSEPLSTTYLPRSIETLKVAVLLDHEWKADEATHEAIVAIQQVGLKPILISDKLGAIKGQDGKEHEVMETYHSATSVLYDALLLVKTDAVDESQMAKFEGFIDDAFNHKKPILYFEGNEKAFKKEQKEAPGVVKYLKPDDIQKTVEPIRYYER